jgi:hypothetical protein
MLPKAKPGLVPIGGGFYATPNVPQPPNYQNPFSRRPLAIEFRPVLDECNFGVEFNGVMMFMRLPAFQLVYRKQSPECNPTPKMYAEPQSVPPGENYIMGSGYGILVRLISSRNTIIHDALGPANIYGPSNSTGSFSWRKSSFLEVGYKPRPTGGDSSTYRYIAIKDAGGTTNKNWGSVVSSNEWSSIYDIFYLRGSLYGFTRGSTRDFFPSEARYMHSDDVNAYITKNPSGSWNTLNTSQWGDISSFSISLYYVFVPLGDILPPPPPPPKFKEMEECCRETLALLRVINKKLGTLPTQIPNGDKKPIKVNSLTDLHLIGISRIEKRIGDLPAKVPDLITKEIPSEIEIESLGELLLWQIKQLDAVMGKFPIKIKIRDTDSTKEGDQSQEITVPNAAEAINELLGLALTIKRDTHANVVLGMKILPQAGMATKLAQMGLDVGLACAEFLGFSLIQKEKKIPLLFTPGATDLDDLLKEKEVEYLCYENAEKTDLMDHIRKILEMVARWTAQNWRRVDFRNPGSSVLANLYGGIDGMRKGKKEDEQEDFDAFTEQSENGFINVVGISDTENPWGDDFAARPRIREIGEDKIKEQ